MLNNQLTRWIWAKMENIQDRINASRNMDLDKASMSVVGGVKVYHHNNLLQSKLGVDSSNPHAYVHTDGKMYVNLAFLTLPETHKVIMVMREGIHANVRGANRGVLYNVLGVTPESLQREFDVDDSLVDDGYGPILLDIMRRQWDKKPTFILKKRIEHIAPQLIKS